MNEPLLVAFSTQKGGAGKTTLTVLTASYLHYVKGLNVAVVDCDFPQFSIKDMRERDMKNIEQNERFQGCRLRAVQAIAEKSLSGFGKPSRRCGKCSREANQFGDAARHHLFRFAGNNVRYGHRQYDSHDGLYLLSDCRRPCRHGKFPAIRLNGERPSNQQRQSEHQRIVSAVEHGGRAGKDRPLPHL